MKTAREIRKRLKQFSPRTKVYRYTSTFKITSEIKYLEKAAECQWLIDFINGCQSQFRRFLVQHWKVDIIDDTAIVSLFDSNHTRIYWKCLPSNGFPLREGIELLVCCDLLYVPRQRRGWMGMVGVNGDHRIAA